MDKVERIGVLLSRGDDRQENILPLESIKSELAGQEDLFFFEAPTGKSPDLADYLSRLCEEEGLTQLVVNGRASDLSNLPEWVHNGNGGPAVPIIRTIPWVQGDGAGEDNEAIKAKAGRMLQMAIARSRGAAGITLVKVTAERRIAVVGGNHAAYAMAETLIEAGFKVLFLDGGQPKGCYYACSEDQKDKIRSHPSVEMVADATVKSIDGGVGAYRLKADTADGPKTFTLGAIILAVDGDTGALALSEELNASGQVMTLREYGEQLSSGHLDWKRICIWLDRQGVDRRCAAQAATGFALAHARQGGRPTILAHHMPVYGLEGQQIYDEARAAGVTFLRYNGQPPEVSISAQGLNLAVRDTVLNDRILELAVERLVLPEPAVPASINEALSKMLHQPLDQEGYLQSGNVRHRPTGSSRRGLFFVGGCHDECNPREARLEAQAVLAELMALLPPEGTVALPADKVKMDKGKCAACLTCVRACPHGAIQPAGNMHKMEVLDPACWQCGICAAMCPGRALEHGSMQFSQFHQMLSVGARDLLGQAPIIAFACRQSAIPAAENAEEEGCRLPATVLLIDVPCAGLVSDQLILDALEQGARGVMVLGCHHDNCRSMWGSDLTRKRVDKVGRDLKMVGAKRSRVQFHTLAANESHRLAHLLEQAVAEMPEGRIGETGAPLETGNVALGEEASNVSN